MDLIARLVAVDVLNTTLTKNTGRTSLYFCVKTPAARRVGATGQTCRLRRTSAPRYHHTFCRCPTAAGAHAQIGSGAAAGHAGADTINQACSWYRTWAPRYHLICCWPAAARVASPARMSEYVSIGHVTGQLYCLIVPPVPINVWRKL